MRAAGLRWIRTERRPTLAAIIVLGAALELVLQSYARGRDWTRTSAD
jgi:hypothetical protein